MLRKLLVEYRGFVLAGRDATAGRSFSRQGSFRMTWSHVAGPGFVAMFMDY